MNNQVIIAIGREFGSGGHEIADKLAKAYNLPLYDRNLLSEIAAHKNADFHELEELDESKPNRFLTRTVRGLDNSPAANIARLQFNAIKEKADNGESFVIVGRCAETVLKDCPALISIFVLGDIPVKSERIQKLYSLSESKALALMKDKDKKRKKYHNEHSLIKWGDSRGYDICINSSRLGVEKTVESLKQYIDTRLQAMNA